MNDAAAGGEPSPESPQADDGLRRLRAVCRVGLLLVTLAPACLCLYWCAKARAVETPGGIIAPDTLVKATSAHSVPAYMIDLHPISCALVYVVWPDGDLQLARRYLRRVYIDVWDLSPKTHLRVRGLPYGPTSAHEREFNVVIAPPGRPVFLFDQDMPAPPTDVMDKLAAIGTVAWFYQGPTAGYHRRYSNYPTVYGEERPGDPISALGFTQDFLKYYPAVVTGNSAIATAAAKARFPAFLYDPAATSLGSAGQATVVTSPGALQAELEKFAGKGPDGK